MGVDLVGGEVIDRAQPQPALERPPGFFDPLQLLVAKRHVFGAERVVIAVDHELAIEPGHGLDLGLIDPGHAGLAQAQIASITATGAQRADPLAVTLARLVAEALEFCAELVQNLGTVLLLTLGLVGIEADDIMTPAFPFTDHHPPEIVDNLLEPARTARHLLFDLAARRDRHGDDVAPTALGQDLEIGLGDHAGIADSSSVSKCTDVVS